MRLHRFIILTALLYSFISVITFESAASQSTFINLDDPLLITQNTTSQGLHWRNVMKAFTSYDPELYIPMTLLSYQVTWSMCGNAPACYHFTDLFIHTLNAIVLGTFLYLITEQQIVAVVCGLLFLLHPLNVESFAWASGRKDLLAACATFLALCIDEYYEQRASINTNSVARKKLWLLSVITSLGILSKVSAICIPALLIVLDLFARKKNVRTVLSERFVLCIISIIGIAIALGGKHDIITRVSALTYAEIGIRSWAKFFMSSAHPKDLSVLYPLSSTNPTLIIAVMVLSITLSFIWVLRRKLTTLIPGICITFVALAPSFFNSVKGGTIYVTSDRYAYIPLVGLLIIIAEVLTRLMQSCSRVTRFSILSCIVIILIASGVQARTVHARWKNSENLYSYVISLHPTSALAFGNRGEYRLQVGKLEEALDDSKRSLELQESPRVRANIAAIHSRMGEEDLALQEYTALSELYPTLPDGPYGMGLLESRRKKIQKAILYYEEALRRSPEHLPSLQNLFALSIEQQQWNRAKKTAIKILSIHPNDEDMVYNLRLVEQQLQENGGAEPFFTELRSIYRAIRDIRIPWAQTSIA